MEPYVYWFALAFVMLAAEMASGTFYLLVLSLSMMLGGVAALAGGGLAMQYALAGAAAIAGTVILRRVRGPRAGVADAGLDVGQAVRVVGRHEDGTLRVHYRGTEWDAEPESAEVAAGATLYIKAVRGSKLILTTRHKS